MNTETIDDLEIPSLCNCTKIRRAARYITRYYDSCLAPIGLKTTQYTLIAFLKHRGPMPMLQLAQLMAIDRATIAQNLRLLERDGLVKITVGETDRRSRIISITEAGLQRIAEGRPNWDRAQAEFEKFYGGSEALLMRGMMDKVLECDLGPLDGPL
ncbi:DNA-binding MarR family transcriptional regulator [Rhizobium sp. BK313]|uniref:MarR family winged helix-turn-helix transcriptional regulator n=1 Tax=Rhizobium sp. BK313 TaxID=2587081 RepID=UPI0010E9B119|nr:MarR family winged helix-turn-helix transcriptional regulator [Rhizobium sp. BK313]MBB3458305.1 DNA-binding MarR family transcriptional regulator [Rhizobium sp. BK313]